MPNVSLLPGEKDLSWDDIIAATDRGIAIIGDGSFSIDQQRYNAQFGGQVFYEIKGGKIVGMLKDVAYQMRTPGLLELDGHDRRQERATSWAARSSTARDSPGQIRGRPRLVPARFRNINVINTGEERLRRPRMTHVRTRKRKAHVERVIKMSKADECR